MDPKKEAQKVAQEAEKKGQGFNNSRGEVPEPETTPKNNGLNVDNDPKHQKEREHNKAA